ncbi:MAG: TIGR03936 family radical SAM-associated protein [Ruminococcus sp.]|uniref:TIGR03936 family radical SAM-associated protein n=1 Tax=Ruminococcus sp. TaxID=41978 RepID=UPI0025CD3DF4|nr:TIGR03936 family radical SAM-associated protein [Ruminococcus sp.]MBR5682214.1 TIGR03936 family radical SAM-associated protein [Ruminococcus sp.]
MIRVRATFEKCGRAKYISHLDLNRCMLRTFRRSRLPIWYTEGFNPHPYYSFALALSLGFESSCEILDFNLNEDIPFDEIRDRLNAVMPEGMRIVRVAEQKQKITAITEAEYSFSLVSDDIAGLYDDIGRMLELPEILIKKKTKKGMKMVDIKPDMQIKSCEKGENSIDMSMRLPAGTQTNLNPTLFIESLKNFSNISFEAEKIRRTGIFCADNEIFS